MTADRDLFWKLIEPEHPRARAYCRKLMQNREDGDDLYQDVLVTALTRFGDLREHGAFRSWLYRIIVNSFKNRVRRPWWKRAVSLSDEIAADLVTDSPESAHAARRLLTVAFHAVSPQEQALLTLFELEGWSVAELAQLTGKKEGAVKVGLSRTRRRMRQAIAHHWARAERRRRHTSAESEETVCVAPKPGLD